MKRTLSKLVVFEYFLAGIVYLHNECYIAVSVNKSVKLLNVNLSGLQILQCVIVIEKCQAKILNEMLRTGKF